MAQLSEIEMNETNEELLRDIILLDNEKDKEICTKDLDKILDAEISFLTRLGIADQLIGQFIFEKSFFYLTNKLVKI